MSTEVYAAMDAPQGQAHHQPQQHSASGGFNFIPIEIAHERASKEAKELDESLVSFPLFEFDVTPLLPLYEVEAPAFVDEHPGCADCCKSFTKLTFLFFNYLTILAYPCAVCYKEQIRFCGYCGYYFCVVPSRYYANFVAKPAIDSYYRYVKPKIVCIQLIFFRPVIALYAQCCHATWDPVCGRAGGVHIEAKTGGE